MVAPMKDDPVLETAMEKLKVATEQVRELEQFIAMYRSLKSGERAQASDQAEQAPSKMVSGAVGHGKPWPTEQILRAAGELLAQRGPMLLGPLHEALVARGVVIGGKRPRNNLCAKMSAEPRFVSDKARGWWFADEPLPGETRLARDRLPVDQNEEGPEPFGAEPLHMNGAAGSYPA